MSRWRALALGIDIGSTHVRIACAERNGAGERRLRAVATQPLPSQGDPVLAAVDAVREAAGTLGASERRCVTALRPPDATVALRAFPKMSARERRRSARFEAEHSAGWDVSADPVVSRLHAVDRETALYAAGLARSSALSRARRIVEAARLRLAAVDLDAYALRRALPGADVVVDVGLHRTSVHIMAPAAAASALVPAGGSAMTRAIGNELALEEALAEERKLALGAGGVAVTEKRELVASVSAAVARLRRGAPVRTLAVVGNGSRLAGLARDMERETGARIASGVPATFSGDAYPDDVIAAALPDWALAVGLAYWDAGA